VVSSCIAVPSRYPHWNVLEIVYKGLVSRDLLQSVAATESLLFIKYTQQHYKLGERTYSMVSDCIPAVEHLVSQCQADRPDIWDRLLREVANGIRSQTEAFF
jgi:hypothetical protein